MEGWCIKLIWERWVTYYHNLNVGGSRNIPQRLTVKGILWHGGASNQNSIFLLHYLLIALSQASYATSLSFIFFIYKREIKKMPPPTPSRDVVRIRKDSIFEALGILLSLRNVRCGYQWLQRFKWFSSSLVFQGSLSSWFIRRTFVDP